MRFLTILAPLLLLGGSLVLAHFHHHDEVYARDYDQFASLDSRGLGERDAYPDALADAYQAGYLAARYADAAPAQLERRETAYECTTCRTAFVRDKKPSFCPNPRCSGHKDRNPDTIRIRKSGGKA